MATRSRFGAPDVRTAFLSVFAVASLAACAARDPALSRAPVPPVTSGQLRADEDPEGVTIVFSGEPSWKASVSRRHGGALSRFHLPAEGPNLVHDGNNLFAGMFFMFLSSDKRDPSEEKRKEHHAKTTNWGKTKQATVRAAAIGPEEVVVDVNGDVTGWRMLGPSGEIVARFTLRYSFRRDRIGVDGAVTWVYGHETQLGTLGLNHFFAPGSVNLPVRMADADTAALELPVTSSQGEKLPSVLSHPVRADLWLRNGRLIQLRTTSLPDGFKAAPVYFSERPWQQEWAETAGFISKQKIPVNQRVPFGYELLIPAELPRNAPPLATIAAPGRALHHKPGDTVTLTGVARDREEGALSPERLEWVIQKRGSEVPVLIGRGETVSLAIPGDAEEHEFQYVARLTATDATGLSSIAFVTIAVAR